MDIVLDVAFIIAVTAFLKQQFGLEGRAVLVWAFIATLLIGFAPLIAAAFPVASPVIDVTLKVIGLFLAAVGAYDFAVDIKAKKFK